MTPLANAVRRSPAGGALPPAGLLGAGLTPYSTCLLDGTPVSIREMQGVEAAALQSTRARHHAPRERWPDYSRHVAHRLPQAGLIALDADHRIQGHAIYFEAGDEGAELALEVAGELMGRGLGPLLVERLAQVAERQGIDRFTARVLPANRAMLEVLRDGLSAHVTWSGGVNSVEFPTSCAARRANTRACAPRPSAAS